MLQDYSEPHGSSSESSLKSLIRYRSPFREKDKTFLYNNESCWNDSESFFLNHHQIMRNYCQNMIALCWITQKWFLIKPNGHRVIKWVSLSVEGKAQIVTESKWKDLSRAYSTESLSICEKWFGSHITALLWMTLRRSWIQLNHFSGVAYSI